MNLLLTRDVTCYVRFVSQVNFKKGVASDGMVDLKKMGIHWDAETGSLVSILEQIRKAMSASENKSLSQPADGQVWPGWW